MFIFKLYKIKQIPSKYIIMQYLLFLDKQLHRIIAFRDQSEAERDAALNSKLHIMLVMHKPLLFMLLLQYIKKAGQRSRDLLLS